jgi:hypothetical protein
MAAINYFEGVVLQVRAAYVTSVPTPLAAKEIIRALSAEVANFYKKLKSNGFFESTPGAASEKLNIRRIYRWLFRVWDTVTFEQAKLIDHSVRIALNHFITFPHLGITGIQSMMSLSMSGTITY